MKIEKEFIGYSVIGLVTISCIAIVLMLDPIAQDLKYHLFRDKRTLLGIPNFWNVISNIPFFIVGIMGLHNILRSHRIKFIGELKSAYILLFLGVSIVGFGSAYYHLRPSNSSLVWDRLPMTIAFMSLFAVIIAEFVSVRLGKYLLWPLVVFGAFSIIYWDSTERSGDGDLRMYVVVQFLPIILIPIILLIFKSKFNTIGGYWLLLCAYALAKVFEYFDETIYSFLHIISGHSLKHVIAAIGVLLLLRAYKIRALA